MHTGPAEWWQIVAALGPLAVLLGALIAGVIGWRTLKQKAEADNRAEWWKRTQWALDAVYSGDKKLGTIGLKVLKVLGESELAGDGELAVLEAASERPLDQAAQARLARATGEAPPASETRSRPPQPGAGVDGEHAPRDNGGNHKPGETEGGAGVSTATQPVRHGAHAAPSQDQPEEVFDEDDRAMQIAAAQLREVTDRRLGKVTPEWVKDLAREQPPSHTA